MSKKRILLSSPTMHGEEMQYINEAFEKNWIAPLGFNCDNFEKEIAEYLNDEEKNELYALSLSSGTAAIHLALKLAGVKPGESVFCSDMTFIASANPVLYEGAVPVFIDSERETWNLIVEQIEGEPYKVVFNCQIDEETPVELFTYIFGDSSGNVIGLLDGVPVSLSMGNDKLDEKWEMEEMDIFYTMREESDYILNYLIETGKFTLE